MAVREIEASAFELNLAPCEQIDELDSRVLDDGGTGGAEVCEAAVRAERRASFELQRITAGNADFRTVALNIGGAGCPHVAVSLADGGNNASVGV